MHGSKRHLWLLANQRKECIQRNERIYQAYNYVFITENVKQIHIFQLDRLDRLEESLLDFSVMVSSIHWKYLLNKILVSSAMQRRNRMFANESVLILSWDEQSVFDALQFEI